MIGVFAFFWLLGISLLTQADCFLYENAKNQLTLATFCGRDGIFSVLRLLNTVFINLWRLGELSLGGLLLNLHYPLFTYLAAFSGAHIFCRDLTLTDPAGCVYWFSLVKFVTQPMVHFTGSRHFGVTGYSLPFGQGGRLILFHYRKQWNRSRWNALLIGQVDYAWVPVKWICSTQEDKGLIISTCRRLSVPKWDPDHLYATVDIYQNKF